ncbi:hypothetical protein SNE40_003635 [Patella caerulea]|uniref:RING-type E3 ubiquitin transferase n=1 Tax=Patella caerulea TaxID=87958 RepID=A0AAN8QFG6_PATCE
MSENETADIILLPQDVDRVYNDLIVLGEDEDNDDNPIEIDSETGTDSDILFSDGTDEDVEVEIIRPPNPVPVPQHMIDYEIENNDAVPPLPVFPNLMNHEIENNDSIPPLPVFPPGLALPTAPDTAETDTNRHNSADDLNVVTIPTSRIDPNIRTALDHDTVLPIPSVVDENILRTNDSPVAEIQTLPQPQESDVGPVNIDNVLPVASTSGASRTIPHSTSIGAQLSPLPASIATATSRTVINSPSRSPAPSREVRVLLDQNQSIDEFRSPKKRKLMSPVKKKSPAKEESDDEGDTCPICFELWTTSGIHRLISLKCGHLFGQSCIQKWLKGQGGKCPQCNAKAKRQDIRLVYAKCIRALDTSERDRALQELAAEKEAKRKIELEAAQMRLKYHQTLEECKTLRIEQDRLRREMALMRSQSSSGNNNSFSASQPSTSVQSVCKCEFVHDRVINISDAGKCRVLAFSSSLGALLVSQPSASQLFKGFGVKKISTMDFKTSQYLTIHSKVIRDICFHPVYDDGILLSCGMDKSIKMTSIMSNTVVQSYGSTLPIWSCVWNTDNKSYFYAGLQNGTVLEFDTRNTSEAVQEINKEGSKSPVVALQYIPKDDTADFKHEGLLVGQLDRTSFYEKKTDNEMRLHLLPLDGSLTSLCFERSTRQLLASFRPSAKYPYARHQICKMTTGGDLSESQSMDDICSCTPVHTFKGSKTQAVLSRSTLFPTGDDADRLIVCGGDEPSSMVHTWDSISGKQLQRISSGGVPVDITSIQLNDRKYLAALTDKHVKIFKWQ